ncbi:hypothetical protein [Streptomyces sp. TRM68367]|uniref:hypothetical protein n=1 Tax=Streptomyces sp. TRM68367 TaxID=2758415 RepID=UPI00165AD6A6|nr:hypothetical protein [Streptomyces sp. TRM68367]MBC9726499.1 hypothetical protein [Streptomyces sp. TRM68367]
MPRPTAAPLLVCVLAVLLALVTGVQPASAADGRPYTNPLKSAKGAGPRLTYHDGNYFLVTTTFTGVLRSGPGCTDVGSGHG